MESETVGGKGTDLQRLLASCCRVNRKAKMVLELLGFRSAAALPHHLHAAVLQVLLLGSLGPFSANPPSPATAEALAESTSGAPQLLPLRSEGCAIQCLFAAWLLKTSKWLKASRLRYVVLLAVSHEAPSAKQEHVFADTSRSGRALSASQAGRHSRGASSGMAEMQQQQEEGRIPLHLLLVAFKAPQEPRLGEGGHAVDARMLQRLEPSEAFTIANTHRALCRRVPYGKTTQLVLAVEGLGGRLLVLGQPSYSTTVSSPGMTNQVTGSSPLEHLAHLVNTMAPFCGPPRPSRWRGLLQLFAAAVAADGLDSPASLPVFVYNGAKSEARLKRRQRPLQETTGAVEEVASDHIAAFPQTALSALPRRVSLVTLLVRCTVAACCALCRPLTLIMRLPATADAVSPTEGPRFGDAARAVSMADCKTCSLLPDNRDKDQCSSKGCAFHSSWAVHNTRMSRGPSFHWNAPSDLPHHQRTLRQLIDEEQIALASLALRERCHKVALLQQEHQMLYQQSSRAPMDERGQLFPQVCLCQHTTWFLPLYLLKRILMSQTLRRLKNLPSEIMFSVYPVVDCVHANPGSPLDKRNGEAIVDAVLCGAPV
ncbi:uncharacterized protein LOC34622801 [Cyclospora cayetanensis]|nr:uncharacterized protein LOC34622801 [Cyclospora cayetanensis]